MLQDDERISDAETNNRAGAIRHARHGEAKRYFEEVALAYIGDDCLIWPFSTDGKGYASLRINGRTKRVSRLVCEHVNGPAPTAEHEAAHSCGRGHAGCVARRHMSWKTPADNQMDRVLHGTSNRGSRHGRAKLVEDQVREMRALAGKIPQRDIAARFGVTPTTVCAILRGRSWAWLCEAPAISEAEPA